MIYTIMILTLLRWIPSLVGIVGNIKVDLLARTPSLFPPIVNISIPANDLLLMSCSHSQ